MTEHVFGELPLLLTGDANRVVVSEVVAHLRECDDCRDELISALVAHASLTSAARYAHDLVVDGLDSPLPVTSEAVIASAIPLPDLSAVFAQVRREADGAVIPLRRRRSPRILLAAAAAVVVVALGGGIYLSQRSSSTAPSRSVALSAFDQGTSSASARLVGDDRMVLDASSLPRLGAGHYYEVWLTNSARTSMAPIGVLGADGHADFGVPSTEMTNYAAIEVSVQDTSGIGSYSGHSVLRGDYA